MRTGLPKRRRLPSCLCLNLMKRPTRCARKCVLISIAHTSCAIGFRMPAPVLVVDDAATVRRIISELLSKIGFDEIRTAADGFAAVEQLRKHRIPLVISDWNMCPMDGLELLKKIRSERRLRQTRFILISGQACTQHVLAAQKAGVSSFLLKPFNAEALKIRIQRAFNVHAN